jgi:putative tryptophan/tyrosine transport system substrate-binding protein
MKRRDFMMALAGAAAGFPPRANATRELRRIGVLMGVDSTDASAQARVAAFRAGLAQLGWTEGRDLRIDVRWAGGDARRMGTEAAALVAQAPDAILASSTPATAALRDATRTIPIVFVTYGDPVARGFVASMGRPGGNITGFTNFEETLGGKWLEVLHDIAPRVRRVGFMFNPATAPRAGFVRNIETDAASLGMQPLAAEVRDPGEIGQAIGDLGRNGAGGLVILPDVFNTTHRATIIADTARHRVPAIYSLRFFVLAGGLISYGIDNIDVYRRAASYVDRILNGARPGELPVQLPSTFECAVNLTTLNALGRAVTPKLNVMANEMIE